MCHFYCFNKLQKKPIARLDFPAKRMLGIRRVQSGEDAEVWQVGDEVTSHESMTACKLIETG